LVINLPQPDDEMQPAASSCGSGGGCSSGEPCGSGLEKVYPTVAVRYGYMHTVGEFRYASPDMKFGCGANVIIQTRRGIEFGEMVSLTCDGCDKSVSREQIKRYVAASGSDYYNFSNGKILRLATPDDEAEWDHLRAETLNKKKFCQERADEHNLPMKVLECEHLFGGERTIFYFMSESRVDFRDLVRGLASEFRTRIEMRQVGARDEARLLADYETCGRECCCKNFLKSLKPVSMKMAKMQKATLDPAKVSGRCGRLKCCLRYEHTTYEELDKKLPNMGKRVQTPQGVGKVIGRQILTQLVLLATDDGGRLTVPVEDVWEVGKPAPASVQEKLAEAAQPQRQSMPQVSSGEMRSGEMRSGDRIRDDRNREDRSRGGRPDSTSNRVDAGGVTPQSDRPARADRGGPSDESVADDSNAEADATTAESADTGADASPDATQPSGDDQRGDNASNRNRPRRGRRNRSRKRGPRSNRGEGNSPDGNRSSGNPPTGNGPSADK
jgi:cell fate regulator YaaT (PSP1 superfamily)